MHLKVLSAKWRSFCIGLNMLSNLVTRQSAIDKDMDTSHGINFIHNIYWVLLIQSRDLSWFRIFYNEAVLT